MLPVELQGLGKWELVYFSSLQPAAGTKIIDPIELPLLATSRYLIVGTRSTTAKPTWYRAGYLTQFLENINIDDRVIFVGTGNPSYTVDAATQIIKLNQVQLVIFPNLAATYRLFFQPVRWINQLNLSVWQFTGYEVDFLQILSEIQARLP